MGKYYKTIWINGKQKRLHRYIMECHLGRELDSNELIHHKDGNIFNNKIQNLELITRKEHLKTHNEIKEAATKAKQKYIYPHDKIKKMWIDKKMTSKKIAEELNIPIFSIHYYIRKNNWNHR